MICRGLITLEKPRFVITVINIESNNKSRRTKSNFERHVRIFRFILFRVRTRRQRQVVYLRNTHRLNREVHQ